MKKSYYAALTYMILGLVAGVYYREIAKAHGFTGETQLSVVHTHLLALGMLFFLIVLVLERTFRLSANRWFAPFFWFYNAGLVVTTGVLVYHGTSTVLGGTTGAAVSGIAGLGHILLTAGLVFLFINLHGRAIEGRAESASTPG